MFNLVQLMGQYLGLIRGQGQLIDIFTTNSAGQPMGRKQSVEAVMGKGLAGDRYFTESGYWYPVEACQVTLISEHDIQLAERGSSFDFKNGCHRRNLVVGGIKTKILEGKVFRIGEAVFEYDKKRPPCGYLNKIEGKGMALALSYNSGVCINVLQSGKISVGDKVEVIEKGKRK